MPQAAILAVLRSRYFAVLPVVIFAATSAQFAGAAEIAAINQALQKYVDDHEVAGVVTLVADHGKVVHLGVIGLADLENNRPMTPDTLFGIMSMTKPITATALMILKEEGKLSYDDPVSKYIPAFADAKLKSGEPVQDLTIRNLITHTSGLGGEQKCDVSLEATADSLAKRPFDFQPGEMWQYSPGLNVCGRIIEIASGQPYEEFLAERIFKPLGMTDTTFHLTDEQRRRLAQLYSLTKSEGADKAHLKTGERWAHAGEANAVPNPSGGLFSTAHDLDRFYQAILNGGELDGQRIVSAAGVREMTNIQTGDIVTGFTPGNGWGLGWCVVRDPQGVTGALSPGTFGHGGAFGTEGWVDPVKQRIYVLLFQRSDIGNSDGADIRKDFQQAAADALDKK
jgi:CubicO group peptidase (beta-lactamase class C family)